MNKKEGVVDFNEVFNKRYASLNKAQKEAVSTIDGPVMVIAGPGSGKTELLSLRIGNILREGSAKASNILCLTFTETAARNMRERLEKLIGPDAFLVVIYTFHSFCTDVIGRYPEFFFDHITFKPASDLTQSEILEDIFKRLPHKHVLGAYHKERGYAYLKEVQSRIKDIKKGGLTPLRFREILDENSTSYEALHEALREHLPERIGKDSINAFGEMKDAFRKINTPLALLFAASVESAISHAETEEKNTPLSEWKSSYTGKDENGVRVFKEYLSLPKLYALGEVYEKYQQALHDGGLFDYEDMILQVVVALGCNETLRTELEEQYQYIMVDEFQDTNNAQLTLVKALSSSPVHEGRPNVCVVGDDDQAIYKFQGAEISNIHSFQELYRDVRVVVLTENYRSTQKVLDFARVVVTQGVNRLENTYKEINKELVAKNASLSDGDIVSYSFSSEEEEYTYVAREIRKLLDDGVEAKEIAVISREHKGLTSLLSYLDKKHVPYTYTRKENVFDEVHVRELITICRYLGATLSDDRKEYLLPEILSFSFWGFDRLSIWRIAEHAKREHISWMEAMLASNDENVRTVAMFLTELSVLAETSPLEIILDTLIGSKDMPITTEDEEEDFLSYSTLTLSTKYASPYKKFYFGEEILKNSPSKYIHFLSSLRVFMRALREWRHGELLKACDVGDFVDMHVAYNIPLINQTPFAHNENSVELLTSHGAKGLEFAYVFIISLDDSVWAGRKMANKISFPINLPLAQAGDNEDDFIRLLYVALTRARHTLYLTHHESLLRYLQHPSLPRVSLYDGEVEPLSLVSGLSPYHAPPFAQDEKALLKKVIEGYTLSPTHLSNFLDVTKGGPITFLENNLLRFPQAKTTSGVYGSAIHKAFEEASVYATKEHKTPTREMILATFEREMKYGRLLPHDEEKLIERGRGILSRFYELRKDMFDGKSLVEIDFKHEGVVVDGASVTGKIDTMKEIEDKVFHVIDLKTGKGFSSFDQEKLTDYDEIKLHHYRHQLFFYKILIENGRRYQGAKVSSGSLLFVEEEEGGVVQELTMSFDDSLEEERIRRLIGIVYKKIIDLDFPDISLYEKNIEGIKRFEEDLLKGVI
jgi:DNA helicase-2/ATP-dependent DNA helicase PcrA